MTQAELLSLETTHPYIQWQDDIEHKQVRFRNAELLWYQAGNETAVSYGKLDNISVDELIDIVNSGFQVQQMTRVTGYYSKVNQWNPGKRAELKDRRRMDLYGNPASIGMKELDAIQKEMAVA